MRYFFKKSLPVVVIILISLAVFFGYNYVAWNLKSFILRFSEENFNVKVSIGYVGIALPLSLELKNITVDDSIEVSSVRVCPNFLSFLVENNFVGSTVKIINPVVRVKKKGVENLDLSGLLKKKKEQILARIPAAILSFYKVEIHNGSLIYNDGREDMLEFVKVKGEIKPPAIYRSKDNIFQFTARGFLKSKDTGSLAPLALKGRLEPDNSINAELYATDIKLNAMGAIYRRYLKGAIKEGDINLKSDINISGNDLLAKCSLETKDIVLADDQERRMNTPFAASFILLFSFKSRVFKIKEFQGNFFKLIFDQPY